MKALDRACAALASDREVLQSHGEYVVNGRLRCDPYCRSTNDQITSAMDELFKDNPFVLVEKTEEASQSQ